MLHMCGRLPVQYIRLQSLVNPCAAGISALCCRWALLVRLPTSLHPTIHSWMPARVSCMPHCAWCILQMAVVRASRCLQGSSCQPKRARCFFTTTACLQCRSKM